MILHFLSLIILRVIFLWLWGWLQVWRPPVLLITNLDIALIWALPHLTLLFSRPPPFCCPDSASWTVALLPGSVQWRLQQAETLGQLMETFIIVCFEPKPVVHIRPLVVIALAAARRLFVVTRYMPFHSSWLRTNALRDQKINRIAETKMPKIFSAAPLRSRKKTTSGRICKTALPKSPNKEKFHRLQLSPHIFH